MRTSVITSTSDEKFMSNTSVGQNGENHFVGLKKGSSVLKATLIYLNNIELMIKYRLLHPTRIAKSTLTAELLDPFANVPFVRLQTSFASSFLKAVLVLDL